MRNEAAAEKEELENEITALKKSLAEKSKEFNSKVENFKNTLTCLHEVFYFYFYFYFILFYFSVLI